MRVEPVAAVRGAIGVPGVKGISQRAVLLGAIAEGESTISGFGRAAAVRRHVLELEVLDVDALGAERLRDSGQDSRAVRDMDSQPLQATRFFVRVRE